VAIAIALALAAALCNALATVLERLGVETAPPEAELSFKIVTHVVRRPVWIAGLGAMVGAFLFQAAALARGGLTLVQPLLVTELLFLVLILRFWFARSLGWREAIGTVSTVLGLAVFLAVSNQGGGDRIPSPRDWVVVVGACAGAIVLCLVAARPGSRSWRSSWYGVAAGVAFALTACFIKAATTLQAHHGFAFMFEHFEPYAIAFSGAFGLYLTQNAYHAGPITSSQAALLISDPIASIVMGVGLFGDNLRGGPGALALDAVALAVMSVGLFVLCQSPLIATATADDRLARPVTHGLASGPQTASR
jgi:drug/metabolite transporter (DMT)-like permease